MNQIYYFDSYSPPLLNEAMLRRERERRREQRAIAAAATGGALILLCLLTLAFMGAGVVALVFVTQRRSLSCS